MVQERINGRQQQDSSDVHRAVKDHGYHEEHCDNSGLGIAKDVFFEAEAKSSGRN